MNEIIITGNQLVVAVLGLMATIGGLFRWSTRGLDGRVSSLEDINKKQNWQLGDIKERDRVVLYAISALLEIQTGAAQNGEAKKAEEAQTMVQNYLKERPFK